MHIGILANQRTRQRPCHRGGIGDPDDDIEVDIAIVKLVGLGDGDRAVIGVDLVAEVGLFPLSLADLELKFLLALGDNGKRETACDLLEGGHGDGGLLIDVHVTQEHVAVILDIQAQ